ncbi:MAG: prepilin peptidase [Cyanobacteria bacterium SBLK]|nr:prepilin peptidase [Cyanobacteria bacterium SBLK]
MEILFNSVAGIFVFIFGTAIGSFLNVVVYRIPAKLSILSPPSRCPSCLTPLGKSENIPILGWLLLKGKCKHCHVPISLRYPLVEAATGALFLLVFWQFETSGEILGYWAFFSWLLALSLIDIDTFTLPNVLTQSGLVVGLGFMLLWGWQETGSISGSLVSLTVGMSGAVVGLWLFEAIAFLSSIAYGRTAMGAGDAKLAAMLGTWLGWKLLLIAGFLACGLGAIAGVAGIATGWLKRDRPMPFGPFLALGAFLAVFWGNALVSTYFNLFFPAS